MIVVLEVNEKLLLLERVGLWVDVSNLCQILEAEVVLGDVLYAHLELEKCADLVAIEQELDNRVTAPECVEKLRVVLGQ